MSLSTVPSSIGPALLGFFLLGGAAFGEEIRVSAKLPEIVDLELRSNQPATAYGFFEAEIGAKVGGIVEEVMVDIGDVVAKGDPLARLGVPELVQQGLAREAEARQVETGVAAARAGLDAARSEYERVQGLVEKGSLTSKAGDEAKQRFASAEAEFKAAEAALDIAKGRKGEIEALINYATLAAPFDGVVTYRGLDPGDLVGSSSGLKEGARTLLVVQEVDRLRVVSYLPEREAVYLDLGDPVEITLDALPGKVFSGAVARHGNSLDSKTRLMRVEVDLPNPGGAILPGLYGRMSIVLEKRPGAVMVAPDCIRSSEEGACVFVVGNGGAVEKRTVTTGIDDGHRIEILTGLDGTERVVGGMIGRLKEGDVVAVISD